MICQQINLLFVLLLFQMETSLCKMEGAVRLAGNITTMYSINGRLEIYHNGEWGTVCDDKFDSTDAEVVCRQLGKGITGAYSYTDGKGTGTIFLDDVGCNGTEASLDECDHRGWEKNDCSHGEDVGVGCVQEGAIRLDGVSKTTDSVYGKLLIFQNNDWKPACHDHFTNNSSAVVCRQLGIKSSYASCYTSRQGSGSNALWIRNLTCSGSESVLNDCSQFELGNSSCSNSDYIYISCFNGTEGKVRLKSKKTTADSVYGLLQIYHKGIWGAVCHHQFNTGLVEVVCRQLEARTSHASSYKQSSASSDIIWLSGVLCNGSESSLSHCYHNGWGKSRCYSSKFVHISCFNKTETEGKLRLSPIKKTLNSIFGMLEIYHKGVWGAVCKNKFTTSAAEVVCRQLGTRTSHASIYIKSSASSDVIWLSGVLCYGSESSLSHCYHNGWGKGRCYSSKFVHISCFNKTETEGKLRLKSIKKTSNSVYGMLEIYHLGVWGAVCKHPFNPRAAEVVCRQLGIRTSHASSYIRVIGSSKQKIWLTNVVCNGSESTLSHCSHDEWGTGTCYYDDFVHISCFNKTETEGSVRLAEKNSFTNYVTGRLEVYHLGIWGTICKYGFDSHEAELVCKLLGESTNGSHMYTAAGGSGLIWLDFLDCNGTETSLDQCNKDWRGSYFCDHDNDVGVGCQKEVRNQCPPVVKYELIYCVAAACALLAVAVTLIIMFSIQRFRRQRRGKKLNNAAKCAQFTNQRTQNNGNENEPLEMHKL